MTGKILTGTASWGDPEFVKHWYPRSVRAADRLRWYADHFSLVEVNTTFYGVPDSETTREWCDQTPDGFLFNVKLHRFLSRHSTKLELLPRVLRSQAKVAKGRVIITAKLEKAVVKLFLNGIQPLKENRKLGALLLQLSPGFSPHNDNRLEELEPLIEQLHGYTLAVELRNRNWITGGVLAGTQKFFERHKLAFVMVDGPQDPHFMVFPSINLVTNPKLAYLRAHGRNAEAYVRERTVAGRFDYDYPRAELEEIAQRAEDAASEAKEVHVIFNTNKADYAPRAAAALQEILDEEMARQYKKAA
ncbi:MAG: hypothetical protein C5B50_30270 [Verrucomicrobia bacterium]|nr:MAG: hypothetical protein C5B50_30270 [Verrucomicrobiota bacterium]